jgi:hypothetical protein
MARIALIAGMAVAGAFISVATGGLGTFAVGAWAADIIAGAAVGASVGSVLSSIIFPPHDNTAPPMNDLQSMSSAYGSPIPWGYGGYRIAGQVIWAETIKVHKTQQSQGGGKGGGPTSTVYTYTISAALSFGFGPGSITRIWADSKLIYDKTGKGPIAIDTGLSDSNGNSITTPFTPTFYSGTADQPPDPTIQASLGINSTSAYRDQILMVLTDFPLADYGNRLPNFRAEITSSTGLTYVTDFFRQSFIADPFDGQVYPPLYSYIDSPNRVAWVFNQISGVVQRIDLDVNSGEPADPYQPGATYAKGDQVLDTNGNIQISLRNFTAPLHPSPPQGFETGFGDITDQVNTSTPTWQNMGPGPDVQPITLEAALVWPHDVSFPGEVLNNRGKGAAVDTAGRLWVQGWVDASAGGPGTGWAMLRFNPNTLANDMQVLVPPASAVAPYGPGSWDSICRIKSQNTGKNYLYCVGGSNKLIGVLDADAGKFVVVAPWNTGLSSAYGLPMIVPPAVDPATGTAYLVVEDTTLFPTVTAAIVACRVVGGNSSSSAATNVQIDSSWVQQVGEEPGSLLWDGADGTVIMMTLSGAINKINPTTGAVIAQLPPGIILGSTAVADAVKSYEGLVPGDGILRLLSNQGSHPGIIYIRCSDLTVLQNIEQSNWLANLGGNSITFTAYDPLSNSIVCTAPGTSYGDVSIRLYFDRQEVAQEALSDVVADVWQRCGPSPSLLDVSALTGINVTGYPITQQSSGKGILGPLMAAYFFDLIESDNVYKAVLRGQEVTTVIPEGDLGLEKDQYKVQPTIIQEHDLPLVIDVNYADKDLDYQQGKQTYRRSKSVKKTRNRTEINLPMTLSADDAVAIASRMLQTAWAERNQWEFHLWKMNYLLIDPTDVVQFTYNGHQYQTRIGKTAAGQDKTMEITGVSEDPRQYAATPPSAPALGFVSGKISAIGQTALNILDTALIKDTDSGVAGTSGYYWNAASRAANANWPGCQLLQSFDNNTFNPVDVDTTPVTTGTVAAATPAPPTLWAWDYTTRIAVVMNEGMLTSDTPINVLGGSNWCYLNGELLAFCNATLQTDGRTYILDTFLRGLRGTEQYCGTHGLSETLLLVSNATLREQIPTSQLNTQQYFRGITFGQPATTDASTPVTLVGNDLKPYAPSQLIGTRS